MIKFGHQADTSMAKKTQRAVWKIKDLPNLRESAGLNVTEIANISGVSRTKINQLENGGTATRVICQKIFNDLVRTYYGDKIRESDYITRMA